MNDLFLATYSFGPAKLSRREMIRTAAELGFQGMEFISELDEDVISELAEYQMQVLDSMTCPEADGTLQNIDLLQRLGVRYVAGTNLAGFGNHRQALLAAERLERAGKKLAEYGLKLYYHNHTHEWRVDEGEYLMETLVKNTDPAHVCIQMDVGWAACAGADPLAFIQKYPGRVELMHVKSSTGVLGPEGVSFMAPPEDGDGSFPLPPAGDAPPSGPPEPNPEMEAAFQRIKAVSGPMKDCIVDYKTLLPAAKAAGCQVFILERDERYAADPIQCIRDDVAELRKFW